MTDMKRCSRGEHCVHPEADGGWLPATHEYFYARDGRLIAECKKCVIARSQRYREAHPEQAMERSRRWRRNHPDHDRLYYDANKEKIAERNKQYRETHRDEIAERKRLYYARNRDKIRARERQRYSDNREEIIRMAGRWQRKNRAYRRRYMREYEARNRERLREQAKARNAANRERYRVKSLVYVHRRMARKRDLPDTFTADDWWAALDYFDNHCAVCGRPIGFWHTMAADHWIPLSSPDCPGTVPENIVPLCHGIGGCNNSKASKLPHEWLQQTFGKRRAAKIAARIAAYFAWVQERGTSPSP